MSMCRIIDTYRCSKLIRKTQRRTRYNTRDLLCVVGDEFIQFGTRQRIMSSKFTLSCYANPEKWHLWQVSDPLLILNKLYAELFSHMVIT